MPVTIYVTKEAMATIIAIKDLDYYDRCSLADEASTDPTQKEGYYLKSANKLHVAVLPENAQIATHICPDDQVTYSAHISIPANLRGCIFENAPHLPPQYKEIIRYWSGEPLNTNAGGAAYYQNPMNTYMVDLSPLEAAYEVGNYRGNVETIDALVSEGIVVQIAGLAGLLREASDEDFVEIAIPLDQSLLALDNPDFRTERSYLQPPGERTEHFFLRVLDIRNSPDPEHIFVDALRYEELDYGFYY